MWWWHDCVPSVIHYSSFPVDRSQGGTKRHKDQGGQRAEQRRSEGDEASENVTASSSSMQPPRTVLISVDMIRCEWRWVSGVPDLTLSQSHVQLNWWRLYSCCCCCSLREAGPTGGCLEARTDEITKECLWYSFTQRQTHAGSYHQTKCPLFS